MAKSRTITTNLSRVFDGTKALVYVVKVPISPAATKEPASFPSIVYANEACLAWIDLEFADLKEANCVYSSLPLTNEIENKLRGLTPPFVKPNQQQWESGFYVFAEDTTGNKKWRPASTRSIRTGQGSQAFDHWLVIADPPDLIELPKATTLQATDFDSKRLHAEIASLNREMAISHSLNNLVGCSPFSFGLRRAAKAAIDSPQLDLLITGPMGSGREHLARVLFHERNSDHPQARLVPLHCAIADQPMVQQNIKEFVLDASSERQHDCLLLLDIDRLTTAAQIELAGFLQLPNFQLQTIATASKRLNDSKQFHPLLAQLLSTFVIDLMPLSERMEDLPLLAQALLEQTNTTSPKQCVGFSPAAIQMLLDYNWPGNLDELLLTVQSAVSRAAGKLITPSDFPVELQQGIKALQLASKPDKPIDLTAYLEKIEAELIERALNRNSGNKSRSAKLLGISRPRLLRRLKQLGLNHWMENDQANDEVDPSEFEEATE